MGDKLGEEFDAHISGITSYGIYATIDENHCEGMIPMRDIADDYYDFDERNFCLVGRRHHNKYQLGDEIRIKVAQANLEKKQLDFTLAGESAPDRKEKPAASSSSKKLRSLSRRHAIIVKQIISQYYTGLTFMVSPVFINPVPIIKKRTKFCVIKDRTNLNL